MQFSEVIYEKPIYSLVWSAIGNRQTPHRRNITSQLSQTIRPSVEVSENVSTFVHTGADSTDALDIYHKVFHWENSHIFSSLQIIFCWYLGSWSHFELFHKSLFCSQNQHAELIGVDGRVAELHFDSYFWRHFEIERCSFEA